MQSDVPAFAVHHPSQLDQQRRPLDSRTRTPVQVFRSRPVVLSLVGGVAGTGAGGSPARSPSASTASSPTRPMSVQCCVLAATIGGSMLHAWGTLVVQTTALAQDPPPHPS